MSKKLPSAEESWHNGLRDIVDKHDPIKAIQYYGREVLEVAAEVADDNFYRYKDGEEIADEIRKLKKDIK